MKLEQRIVDTLHAVADTTTTSPGGLDRLARRRTGRRRWRRTLTVVGATAVAAAAAVAVFVAAQPRTDQVPTVDPVAVPTADGSTEGAEGTAGDARGTQGWESLTYEQALDRLIGNARTAAPVPTPGPGQVQVERVASAWPAGNGSVPDEIEIVVTEYRRAPDGSRVDRRAVVAALPLLASAEDMRQAYAEAEMPGQLPEVNSFSADELGDRRGYYERAMTDAEANIDGPHEPDPQATERPAQARAFMDATDALRLAVTPDDHVRALELLSRVHPSLVDYVGPVRSLDGTQGVGVAGYDRANTTWNTLILDPDTGRLIGTMGEWRELPDSLAGELTVDGVPPETPIVYSLTARTIEVTDAR